MNEFYLWHGTHVRAALSIAHEDFRIDMAGSNAGTMYGRGCYLAENCNKAAEFRGVLRFGLQTFSHGMSEAPRQMSMPEMSHMALALASVGYRP